MINTQDGQTGRLCLEGLVVGCKRGLRFSRVVGKAGLDRMWPLRRGQRAGQVRAASSSREGRSEQGARKGRPRHAAHPVRVPVTCARGNEPAQQGSIPEQKKPLSTLTTSSASSVPAHGRPGQHIIQPFARPHHGRHARASHTSRQHPCRPTWPLLSPRRPNWPRYLHWPGR